MWVSWAGWVFRRCQQPPEPPPTLSSAAASLTARSALSASCWVHALLNAASALDFARAASSLRCWIEWHSACHVARRASRLEGCGGLRDKNDEWGGTGTVCSGRWRQRN
jgi:hypothetical protein